MGRYKGEDVRYKIQDEQEIGGTTAGRIRETASSCSTADAALRKLFPEVFEEVTSPFIPASALGSPVKDNPEFRQFWIRLYGPYTQRALILPGEGWEVITEGLPKTQLLVRRR